MSFYQSERCFRRYEHIIQKALEDYPNTVRFKSPGRSPETDAARCRDAITSYKRHRWPVSSTVFNNIDEQYLKVWVDRAIVCVGGTVDPDKVQVITSEDSNGQIKAIPAFPSTHEHVLALIDLINENVLATPILVSHTWNQTIQEHTKGMLNISVRVESDGVILF